MEEVKKIRYKPKRLYSGINIPEIVEQLDFEKRFKRYPNAFDAGMYNVHDDRRSFEDLGITADEVLN